MAAKLARVEPWRTSLIILLTIISQVSMLLASFLPLKVVILLGTETLPVYLPAEWKEIGREILIIALSAAAVGFFLVHLLSQNFIGVITQKASKELLLKNKKIILFENQDEIAASTYQRFSRALSDGVFSVCAFLGLALLYLDIAAILLGYLFLSMVMIFSICRFSQSFHDAVGEDLDKNAKILAAFGFFSAFTFLVSDFILFHPPSVIIAIVSLLLARQLLNRFASLVRDVASLYQQRVRINALFFHGEVLMKGPASADKGIWPLLLPEIRSKWCIEVLSRVAPSYDGATSFEWHHSSNRTAGVIKVVSRSGEHDYLLKLFNEDRKAIAIHESTLLSNAPKGLPVPCFLGTVNVSEFLSLVYRIPKDVNSPKARDVQPRLRDLRDSLLTLEPPETLVHRYRRSKPLLWQRLEPDLFRRLLVAVGSTRQHDGVLRLIDHLPTLKKHLRSLPLTVTNPDFTGANILVGGREDFPLSLNWGRWSLEPLGFGWPVKTGDWRKRDQLHELAPAIEMGASVRASLIDVRVEAAELSALLAALEERCLRHQFVDGLELVGRVIERVDLLVGESIRTELPDRISLINKTSSFGA
ncbi:hypothetical protein [Microbulbifer sp. HZ11]|uniref:hypothetical protein n=1 Tax=Microbulbifer sp. HZ11 TaxID=1453501 RepID=UPI0012DF6A5C|nr:hypothetical protein [Microbulbifer sp. HZ11]